MGAQSQCTQQVSLLHSSNPHSNNISSKLTTILKECGITKHPNTCSNLCTIRSQVLTMEVLPHKCNICISNSNSSECKDHHNISSSILDFILLTFQDSSYLSNNNLDNSNSSNLLRNETSHLIKNT